MLQLIHKHLHNRPGTIRSKVISLAGPSLIEMFLVTFVTMADMIMVGRLGTWAIAAVGLTNQPLFFALAIFLAINVGTTALVARSYGGGDLKTARDVAKQSLVVTLILGIIVAIIGVLAAEIVLTFMGAESEVITLGRIYFQIIFLGIVFTSLSMSAAAVLRGLGDTKTPMYINVMANILNVFLNYVLIYGKFGFPELGIMGAGIATTISRAASTLLFSYVLYNPTMSILYFTFKESYKLDFGIIKRIYKISNSAALEQFFLRGGQVIFSMVIAGLGTDIFAAHQIAMNIVALSFMPGQAFSMAAATLVGQCLGSGDCDGAEECGNEAKTLGIFVGGLTAFIFFIFGPQLASLYSDSPGVVLLAAQCLRIYALAQPAQSTQFILSGGLRGAGDTKYPLYSTALGIWFGRVLFSLFFINVLGMGLIGAWIALSIDQIGRSFFISKRFKKGAWKALTV